VERGHKLIQAGRFRQVGVSALPFDQIYFLRVNDG
jgi:hypothetical protein